MGEKGDDFQLFVSWWTFVILQKEERRGQHQQNILKFNSPKIENKINFVKFLPQAPIGSHNMDEFLKRLL